MIDERILKRAVRHLKSADSEMARVIEQVGPCKMSLRRHRYQSLVRSIVSQQISTAAARSIQRRLRAVVAPSQITAISINRQTDESLRSAGLSKQKISYLRSLTEAVESKEVNLRTIHKLDDEAVIEQLIQIKGIGRWTAQMFLMFCLGRLDIFPPDDLGIRSAMRNIYDFDEHPSKDEMLAIAEHWSPYTTVACWYCWRSLE